MSAKARIFDGVENVRDESRGGRGVMEENGEAAEEEAWIAAVKRHFGALFALPVDVRLV